MWKARILAVLASSFVSVPVGAATVIIHGTTIGGPLLTRPAVDGSIWFGPAPSGASSAPFSVDAFHTNKAGHFHIASYASNAVGVQGNWDNFLALYEDSFDPLKPLQNAVFFNNDIFINGVRAAGNPSTFISKANVQYFAVTTGMNGASGVYTLHLASQGEITTGLINSAVPEPATWGMMLAGFGAVGASIRGRRKRRVRLSVAG